MVARGRRRPTRALRDVASRRRPPGATTRRRPRRGCPGSRRGAGPRTRRTSRSARRRCAIRSRPTNAANGSLVTVYRSMRKASSVDVVDRIFAVARVGPDRVVAHAERTGGDGDERVGVRPAPAGTDVELGAECVVVTRRPGCNTRRSRSERTGLTSVRSPVMPEPVHVHAPHELGEPVKRRRRGSGGSRSRRRSCCRWRRSASRGAGTRPRSGAGSRLVATRRPARRGAWPIARRRWPIRTAPRTSSTSTAGSKLTTRQHQARRPLRAAVPRRVPARVRDVAGLGSAR